MFAISSRQRSLKTRSASWKRIRLRWSSNLRHGLPGMYPSVSGAKIRKSMNTMMGHITLTFTALSWLEVISWVMSFGAEAEVISPEELRNEVRDTLVKANRSLLLMKGYNLLLSIANRKRYNISNIYEDTITSSIFGPLVYFNRYDIAADLCHLCADLCVRESNKNLLKEIRPIKR